MHLLLLISYIKGKAKLKHNLLQHVHTHTPIFEKAEKSLQPGCPKRAAVLFVEQSAQKKTVVGFSGKGWGKIKPSISLKLSQKLHFF